MHPFEYRAPEGLDEVVGLLQRHGDDAKLLAGGQSLMIMLRQGLVSPAVLVSLRRVEELRGLQMIQGELKLGAMVTYRVAASARVVADAAPALSRAAGSVGSVHIRNLGTVGGSLCHADPAGDVPTVLLVHDATVQAQSPTAERSYDLTGFFTGLFETCLGEDEVLSSVTIPRQPPGCSFGYRRYSYREGEYPLAVAACRLEWDGATCTGARVAVGGGDVSPKSLPDLAAALVGTTVEGAAIATAMDRVPSMLSPLPDVRGSASWKTVVVTDLLSRTVRDAALRTETVDA